MFHSKLYGVHVLSLMEDVERREHINAHFADIGITGYRFHTAIRHDDTRVVDSYNAGQVKRYPPCFRCGNVSCECANNILVPQQVANWLSFLSLWKYIAQGEGLHLVCEDDVFFYQGSMPLLRAYLDKLVPKAEPLLIRLAQSGQTLDVDLTGVETFQESDVVLMSNPAYIINASMAQLLVGRFCRIDTTSDIWLHEQIASEEGVHSVSLAPVLATELSFNAEHARFVSRIHPKGISVDDIERQRKHRKRVSSLNEYREALRSWGVTLEKQWNYLASEPFQLRYMMVAGLLRKFRNILEIGSYKTPLFQFIEDAEKHILSVDPVMEEATKSDRQKSCMMDYRSLPMDPFGDEGYALVVLGLDLEITPKLKHYVQQAEVAVIEYPEDAQWKKSREKYEILKRDLELHELSSVHLDFDDNDFSAFDNQNEWPPRTQRYIKVVSAKHAKPENMGQNSPFEKGLDPFDPSKSKLLDADFIRKNIFPEAAFEFSHGACAATNYLGGGLLYYAIVHMLRPRLAVCLGSGGAFVPRLIRQAQRDLGMADTSRTLLVDGDMGGYGRPNWLSEDSFFRANYSDIEVLVKDTGEVAKLLVEQGQCIDYLHIDADHSHEGSLRDFKSYLPLMRENSLITFHDTKPNCHPSVDCWKTLDDIRMMGYEVIDLISVGNGVAIVKV